MEFLKPQRNYLKRLSAAFLYSSYPGADLRQATSLPTICIVSPEEATAHILQLHRQRIEEELEVFTTQTLARTKRRSKYHAVTIPSSVKHQVTETPSTTTTTTTAAMARPRSPQKKNEMDHEYLQSQLDEQLAAIRQQLNSLSNERAKMEQKMEDLVNGIKEAREVSTHMPKSIIITSSTPTMIRRAHSMDTRKKNIVKTDSEQNLAKYKSAYFQQQMSTSPPLDEVDGDGGGWIGHQRFASLSSVSSTTSYPRDYDVTSVSDSIGSSRRSLCPPSLSEYMDEYLSPTPIPELPESPSATRSVTPMYLGPHSPLVQPRASSSSTSPIPSCTLTASSPSHTRMYSQPSPTHPPPLAQTLLGGAAISRPRSGSLSILTSPRLALKATLSSSDLRSRSSCSPAQSRKKNPGSKLKQHKKDRRLSYFRKDSFEDLDSSLKGSQASISNEDDDEGCTLKGSRDDLAGIGDVGSGDPQDSPTGSAGSTGRPRILRRSSLTGQIEHVTNLRAQVRRNNSFNASPTSAAIKTSKHAPVSPQRSLSVCMNKPRYSLTPTALRRVVFLKSKETTV